jgi:hypothetical protein
VSNYGIERKTLGTWTIRRKVEVNEKKKTASVSRYRIIYIKFSLNIYHSDSFLSKL